MKRLLLGFAAMSLIAAGKVEREPYGTTKGGEAVERLTLTNASGARASILTLGGTVTEISVPDRAGRIENVVLALPDVGSYEARPTVGSIIGRFANRISKGGFTIDGVYYPLSKDPTAVVGHGGTPGFASRVWKAEPCRTAGCSAVTLRYQSPDGENGFPGALDVSATYTLTDDNALRIDYRATTTRPTVINLTNHSYFNLAGGASGSIDAQRIQIMASAFTPGDARRVPTGEIRRVEGTDFDLRQPVRLGDPLGSPDPQIASAKGFDHNFVLDKPKGDPLPVAARASDPVSGRTLEVRTTEPGVQLYTANHFDGTIPDATGRLIRQGAGFALETQHFPDSPNQPGFPSTVLRPGETFTSTTVFKFGVAK